MTIISSQSASGNPLASVTPPVATLDDLYRVEGKAEFISKIVSGKSDFVSIGLNNQTIAVSGSTAIVRHRLDAKTNDNGKPGEVHLQVLLVWQKLHGHWKLLARQAVKIQ